jgi:3-hydroxypropanoate dehydrogenase
MSSINDPALDQLFRTARTHRTWTSDPVPDAILQELWQLASLGPTAMNTCPLRAVFVRSAEAKQRLVRCVDAGNAEKTATAPVTTILAYDVAFHRQMGTLAPGRDLSTAFPDEAASLETARTNALLQAGYFLMAARALGLDCGPMGGFNPTAVDAAFLAGSSWRSFLLCNLGHGDASQLWPRAPRLAFGEGARYA